MTNQPAGDPPASTDGIYRENFIDFDILKIKEEINSLRNEINHIKNSLVNKEHNKFMLTKISLLEQENKDLKNYIESMSSKFSTEAYIIGLQKRIKDLEEHTISKYGGMKWENK